MRTTIRAMLTLLLVATALTATPAVAAHAAPDGDTQVFTMVQNAKPAVDMSNAKVMRFTDVGTVTCYVYAPVPPYFVDTLCYVSSGIVQILVHCSDGSGRISTPMIASPTPYYGRAYCGPPAWVVAMSSL